MNVVIIILLALFVIIGALIGMGRKLIRSTVRLVRIIAAALLAVPLSAVAAPKIIDGLKTTAETNADFLSEIPNTVEALNVFFEMIASIIAYSFVFVLLLIVLLIVDVCFTGVLKKLEEKWIKNVGFSKITGAIVGAIAGVILFAALNMPIAGAIWAVSEFSSENGENTEAVMMVADKSPVLVAARTMVATTTSEFSLTSVGDSAKQFMESPVNSFIWENVQKPLFTSTATADVDGKKINLYDEIKSVAVLVREIAPLLETADDEEISAEAYQQILEKIDNFTKENVILSNAVTGFLVDAGNAWSEGKSVIGIEPILGNPEENSFAKSIYSMLKDASASSATELLTAVDNTLAVVEKHSDTLEKITEGNAAEIVLDTEFVKDLVDAAKENETSEKILDEVTKAVLTSITEELKKEGVEDSAKKAEQIVDDILSSLENALKLPTKEEKKQSIITSFNNLLAEYNLKLEGEDANKTVDSIATAVVDYFGDNVPEKVKAYDLLPIFSDAMNKLGIKIENGNLVLPE